MIPYHDENECLRFPIVNSLLIGINIAVFVYMFFGVIFGAQPVQTIISEHAVVATRIIHHWDLNQLGTIFSSMFMHVGFAHIVGNLWVLYLFGDNVEDRLGHWNYLAFYLVCGLAANAAQIFSNPSAAIPTLGASGAIAGVLGAYMIMFPNVGVRTWITWFWSVTIPAWIIMGVWFILQCANSMIGGDDSIAWYAHIGGFLTGFALTFCLKPAKPPEFIDLDGVRVKAEKDEHDLHHSELAKPNDLAAVIGFFLFMCVSGYLIMHPTTAKVTAKPALASRTTVAQPKSKDKDQRKRSVHRRSQPARPHS
ncbi:MAG: rhomboid family intramembrane serine protease [Cyanobacteria bacterium SZAS-4]|nr:rhomboid family intramembrane serine protease [Cyanobacteria bacterium SZAS-4]